MSEKDLDSSNVEYIEQIKSKSHFKQLEWDMAIGLQEVDNLKPSKYFEKLVKNNIEGNLTIEQVEKDLKEYYTQKEKQNDINDSVAYGDSKTLKESLDYDISLEKEKNYKDMSIVEVINNITNFSSSIWQVHPFSEGNTRTIVLFIEKYLISLGYEIDNTLFKDKSVYFRNALVKSNYFNNYLNIKEDKSYLIKFYENLLLGKNNNLHSQELIVKELF